MQKAEHQVNLTDTQWLSSMDRGELGPHSSSSMTRGKIFSPSNRLLLELQETTELDLPSGHRGRAGLPSLQQTGTSSRKPCICSIHDNAV